MCLDYIDRQQRRTMKEHRGYYQVFQLKKESLKGRTTLHSLFQSDWKVVKVGKWEQAVNSFGGPKHLDMKLTAEQDNTKYLPGFHCYPRLGEAINWVCTRLQWDAYAEKELVIREVCIRRIHTFGRQAGRPVVVASERKVLPLSKELKELKDTNYGCVRIKQEDETPSPFPY